MKSIFQRVIIEGDGSTYLLSGRTMGIKSDILEKNKRCSVIWPLKNYFEPCNIYRVAWKSEIKLSFSQLVTLKQLKRFGIVRIFHHLNEMIDKLTKKLNLIIIFLLFQLCGYQEMRKKRFLFYHCSKKP